VDAGPEAGEGRSPRCSGSATMPDSVAPCVKMMVQLYAASSAEFIHHHGTDGARRYLRAAKQGLELQKEIAQRIWQDPERTSGEQQPQQHIRQLGSYYVAYQEDEEELRKEFETLQSLGCCEDIEWCDRQRLAAVQGLSQCNFYCGIFFPRDAVIDSSLYAKTLLEYLLKTTTNIHFWPNTRVSHVTQTGDDSVVVQLEDDLRQEKSLTCQQVIMATGGLFQIPRLNGLLKPCYSYLVHVPLSSHDNDNCTHCDYSANFFTWKFTHDWCFTEGQIRISGEDHFSAYKSPLCEERCANLTKWTLEQYKNRVSDTEIDDFCKSLPQQYGIYSETPDLAPLIGSLPDQKRITYLVGCNAWGQTILSYCSSLVPGLLGYKHLTESQKDALQLVSIRRFSELPAVR